MPQVLQNTRGSRPDETGREPDCIRTVGGTVPLVLVLEGLMETYQTNVYRWGRMSIELRNAW